MTDDAPPADRPVPAASAPVAERWHRRRVRQIIGALSALALVGGLGGGVLAVTSATRAFGAALGTSRLADAAGPTGTGLRFGDLAPAEQAATLALLESALGPDGYTQLRAAMAADDELDAALGGGTGWGSDDYTVALLTDADGDGFFFQFGGRQLGVNAIYRDGALTVEPELDV